MQPIDQHLRWYQSRFEAFEKSLNGEKSTTVHALRRDAIRRFAEIGFPTVKQEEWRFTNISPIIKNEYQPILRYELNGVKRNDIQQYFLNEAIRLVFINGMFSPEMSDMDLLSAGVSVGSLAERLKLHPELIRSCINEDENAFTALNTAFLQDGAFISVPKGIILEYPIQLLFIATNYEQKYVAQPRNLIIAGENSQFKIVEMYIGIAKNTYLTNAITEIELGENSIIEHDKCQVESANAYHIGTTHILMNTASNYLSNVVSISGSIIRNNVIALMNGERVECTLNGLSLGNGTQIIDNHTSIDNAKPQCNSHELYKAILNGSSKGVFNGKIFVRKDAQKTDAKQTNKTLLLSDDATINTKPQLEIFADDVKCSHGAAIGQLDDEQIFYLRSRGIDLNTARDILTSAFADDVVNRITIESFRQLIERMINDRLNKNHASN